MENITASQIDNMIHTKVSHHEKSHIELDSKINSDLSYKIPYGHVIANDHFKFEYKLDKLFQEHFKIPFWSCLPSNQQYNRLLLGSDYETYDYYVTIVHKYIQYTDDKQILIPFALGIYIYNPYSINQFLGKPIFTLYFKSRKQSNRDKMVIDSYLTNDQVTQIINLFN